MIVSACFARKNVKINMYYIYIYIYVCVFLHMGTHDDQPCDVRVSDDWTNPHMIICISYVYVCVYIYIYLMYIYINI